MCSFIYCDQVRYGKTFMLRIFSFFWDLDQQSKIFKGSLGGFNVSSLMGIKRRMIDIDKKHLTFLKCLKMYSFLSICIQTLQKCRYDPLTNFSWKNLFGYHAQNLMLISNSLMPTLKNIPKKVTANNYASFEYFRFARLLPITYWHKILHFWTSNWFVAKKWGVTLALF